MHTRLCVLHTAYYRVIFTMHLSLIKFSFYYICTTLMLHNAHMMLHLMSYIVLQSKPQTISRLFVIEGL